MIGPEDPPPYTIINGDGKASVLLVLQLVLLAHPASNTNCNAVSPIHRIR
jgi:hypothetical protein